MSRTLSRTLLVGLGLLALVLTVARPGWAQSSDGAYRSSPLGLYPPNIGFGSGGPMVMLAASKDHTLFSPIYTDYEDIDGDGKDDSTFKPTYTYYGYFDAAKCYSYNGNHSTGGRFEPVAMASTSSGFKSCLSSTGGRWSGNFLNWATMTRIDVVRKTLYGGRRLEDSATDTTLEMAQLATDAHSFVKYYSGDDLKHFTPFDLATDMGGEGLTICNRGSDWFGKSGFPLMRLAKGNYSLWATIRGEVCNWSGERARDPYSFGAKVRAFYDKYGPSLGTKAGNDPTAHKVGLPAKASLVGVPAELAVRAQVCKATLLGNERCKAYGTGASKVYKPVGLLQEFATTDSDNLPAQAEFGLITGSYDSNLKGGFLRKNMGSINDEIDRTNGRFCHLLSESELSAAGARCKTAQGIASSFDRIRLYSAGDYNNALSGDAHSAAPNSEFLRPQDLVNGDHASWGNPMSEMITQALAYFAGDATSTQTALGMSNTAATGRDKEVGLPVGVNVMDPLDDSSNSVDPASGRVRSSLYGKGMCRPLHVLAISSGTVSYDTDESGSGDDVYQTVTPFFSRINAGDTIVSLTDRVGEIEGINKTGRSVGSNSGGFGQDCTLKAIGTVVSEGLAQVAGVCPEAPGIKGSYLGAGAAFSANTRAIRAVGETSVTVGGSTVARDKLPSHALRVKTYAASLAGGVARIEVPVGNSGRKVYITPESSWRHDKYDINTLMPGAMLTFRALHVGEDASNPQRKFGSYIVTWNDAQFGGDYDEDLTGFIRWEIQPMASDPSAYELKVMTDVFAMSAGAQGAHGFSIIGVDDLGANHSTYSQPGRYLTHGANGFSSISDCQKYAAATNKDNFDRLCNFENDGMNTGGGRDDYAWPTTFRGQEVNFADKAGVLTSTVTKTFKVTSGVDGVTLRDPLWYIAKYGSFDTGEAPGVFSASVNATPDKASAIAQANWDRQDNANPDCAGTSCADGEPDGYFLARRPELLEARLRQLLGNIAASSNAAPAVSATQLLVNEFKFQAEFNRDLFKGTVKAFQLTSQGVFASAPVWDAGLKMEKFGHASRAVISNIGSAGVSFTDAMLASEAGQPYLKAMLGLSETATVTNAQLQQAQSLVNYMRGFRGDEGSRFRPRGAEDQGIMGPVVSSTPWVQDHRFAARYTDGVFPSTTPSYRAYVTEKAASQSLLWVGSNDGMLHGLKVSDGTPVLSYVPSPLVSRLATALSVSNTDNVALMDGSPFTADVLVPSGSQTGSTMAWRTYLFSSLGRGGKALFALDVTPAASLSTTAATSIFKWVFTAQDDAWSDGTVSEASDLGYNVQDPIRHNASGQATPVVYLNDGNFWLLHPNGHRSDSGRAVLFLFKMAGPAGAAWRDATTGATNGYMKLPTELSGATTAAPNGLMGVTWVDLDNNETADLVYGTDLKGQVWRFDLRDSNPANWRVGLFDTAVEGAGERKEGIPLFAAKDAAGAALPITSAPVATFPSYGDIMLSFGTGRALETGDFPDVSRAQRFFTVWDRGGYVGDRTFAAPKVFDATQGGLVDRPNTLPALGRTVQNASGAQVNTFIERFTFRDASGNVFLAQTNADGTVKRDQQGNPVPLGATDLATRFDPTVHDGWFFSFPDGGSQGEAVISSPGFRSGYVFFTSVRGQTSQEQEQACAQVPSATLYALSPVNGLPVNNLLINGAYYLGVPVDDQKLIIVRDRSGEPSSNPSDGSGSNCTAGQSCPSEPNPPACQCAIGTVALRALGGSGGTSQCMCVPASSLRIQWRELPGLRTQ